MAKHPYTFPHRTRTAKLDYIRDNGGYYSDHTYWPISYNVKLNGVDFSFNNLYDLGFVDHAPHEVQKGDDDIKRFYREYMERVHADIGDESFWEIAVEDARNSVNEDDAHKMLWNGDPVPTKFEFWGRSGGHLVVTEWNGWRFKNMTTDGLCERLADREDSMYADLDLLYRYMRHWEHDFAPDKCVKNVEYQAAFHMFARRSEDAWPACYQEWKDEQFRAVGPVLKNRRLRIRRV